MKWTMNLNREFSKQETKVEKKKIQNIKYT